MNKRVFASALLPVIVAAAASAQQRPPISLPDGPQILETASQRIRVVTLTQGLSHPWGLAFNDPPTHIDD